MLAISMNANIKVNTQGLFESDGKEKRHRRAVKALNGYHYQRLLKHPAALDCCCRPYFESWKNYHFE